jgi:hypothetical protein
MNTNHSKKRKRLLSGWLAAIMVVTLLPMLPQTAAKAYSGSQSSLTLTSGTYTLENVTITPRPSTPAIKISGNVILTIVGTNTLEGGAGAAGINVPIGSSLEIKGSGTLNVTGGSAGNGGDGSDISGGRGGTGAGAAIGGNGGNGGVGGNAVTSPSPTPGANGSNGEDCGTIIIGANVSLMLCGGLPAEFGGAGGPSSTSFPYRAGGGGGGAGYPAPAIGGGGAGGGGGGGGYYDENSSYISGPGGAGGGGYYGGGGGRGVEKASMSTPNPGGTSSTLTANRTGGGSDFSCDGPGGGGIFDLGVSYNNVGGGAIRGGGGSSYYYNSTYSAAGGHGGRGGACGTITLATRDYDLTDATGSNGSLKHVGYVSAIEEIGSGYGYTEPSGGQLFMPPDAPVITTAPSRGEIYVEWTIPESYGLDITKYEITRIYSGSKKTFTINASDATPAPDGRLCFTDSDLQAGTYSYTVRAYNEAGVGSNSEEYTDTIEGAGAPAKPIMSPNPEPVYGGIGLKMWASNNGSSITNYEVKRYRVNNGTMTVDDTFTVKNTASANDYMVYTDSNVSTGNYYRYQVRAYNKYGEGEWSSTYPSNTAGIKPLANFSFATPGPGNGTVDLTWSRLSGVSEYEVYNGDTRVGSTTDNTYTVTGLTNGQSYTFKVRAKYSSVFWGGFQEITATAGLAPQAPTIYVTPGPKRNSISWTAPNDNGSSIMKYELSRKTGSDSYKVLDGNISSTATSYTDTDVSVGTQYIYRLRAYNTLGWGNYSSEKSGIPSATAPDKPIVTGAPAHGSAYFEWSAPNSNGSPITKYIVQRTAYRGDSTTFELEPTATSFWDAPAHSDGEYLASNDYYYTLTAVNALGQTTSDTVNFLVQDRLPMPTAVAGEGQVTLSWSKNDGTKFQVLRGNNVIADNLTETTYTDTTVTNGETYYYTVREYCNSRLWSGDSYSASATPYTVPSAPNAPTATELDGEITISWAAPAANGATITNYEVFRDGESIGTTTELTYTDKGGETGLTNGSEYTYTVRAYNAAGWGNASTGTKAIPRTVPNAPAKPSVTAGDTQNVVTWTVPDNGGSAITEYEVTRTDVVLDTGKTFTTTEPTFTDTGLQTQYGAQKYFPVDMGLFVI